jgi:hypothetical protein
MAVFHTGERTLVRATSKRVSLAVVLTNAAVALSCTAASSAGASSAGASMAATVTAETSTAATGSAGTGTAAAAVSAARPAWRVIYRLQGTDITAVTASGPDNAWAVGNFWDAKGRPHGQLLHWDGSRWRLVSYPDQRVHLISAAYALTATDAWFSVYGSGNGELLHWSNGRWSAMSLPANLQNIDVISDRNIWAVGGMLPHCDGGPGDSRGCTVTSHWNGSAWTSYPLGAFEGVRFGASSSSDVWAVGDSFVRVIRDSPSFVPYVFHWTGSAWKRTGLALHRTSWWSSIVALSPRDVYVAESTMAHRNACAMRWNGSRWTPFYLKGSAGPCHWATSDYHRGLWFMAQPSGPGFAWAHWTGARFVTTPAYQPSKNGWNTDGFTIAAVPHSSLVWLFGSYCGVSRPCRIKGVIAALR